MSNIFTLFQKDYGEVFISSEQTNGAMEVLEHFKGKLIASFGGGCKKIFVTEEKSRTEGIVSCLHAEEFDEYDYTFSETHQSEMNPEQILQAFNEKGQIKQLVAGKRTMFLLNDQGHVYSYGYGDFGALGQGGPAFLPLPKQIPAIKDRFIVQIACGEYHSLALTNNGDVYAWGRGFEGQLGLTRNVETSSTPKYIKFFSNKKVIYIACGAYHSLAITSDFKLYGWGEAKLGQIGSYSKQNQYQPVEITFPPFEKEVNSDFDLNPVTMGYPQGYVPEIEMVAAGYGHTVALSKKGDLYAFGLNIKGQLGVGDRKIRFQPTLLKKDIINQKLPKFKYIACGYYNNMALTQDGKILSWGYGNLGQQNESLQDLPRQVETHVEGRRFSAIFMNQNSALFFAPLRLSSVRPFCGPSNGKTMISLIGTGFKDTGKQIVRFICGGQSQDVRCLYDQESNSFRCMTPAFDQFRNEDGLPLNWPQSCKIQISLDGEYFTQCEHDFTVYNSKIQVNSLNIKCASVQGGVELQLHCNNIDETTQQYLDYLMVGFQLKKKKERETKYDHQSITSKQSRLEKQQNDKKEVKSINPLDTSVNDLELDKENWKCMPGFYENGKISCQIPNVEEYIGNQLQFNIDISINGQQFTGYPSSFKFYNIQQCSLAPTSGSPKGGLNIVATAKSFFDTLQKKVKFTSKFGERFIDPTWDQTTRSFSFFAPPLNWIFGGNEPTEEQVNEILQEKIQVSLTLNGVEWLPLGDFQYFEPQIEWIGYSDKQQTLDEWKEAELQSLTHSEEEQEAEKHKQLEDMQNLFRKAAQYITLNAKNFPEVDQPLVKFKVQEQEIDGTGIYLTHQKIAVELPDFEGLPAGINDIQVEICFNGQQYSDSGLTFRYLAFTADMTEKDRHKMEDDILKANKKKK